MRLNVTLILAGLIMAGVGLYRAVPLKLGIRFLVSNGPLLLAFAVLAIMTIRIGAVGEALRGTLQISSQFAPMLIMLFPVMGLGGVLASHYEAPLKSMMSGSWGYPGTFFTAIVAPGGNSLAKFIELLWQTPTLRPKLLFFLTATPLASYQILLIRSMGLGSEIAFAMYKVNIVIAVCLIPVFWLLGKIGMFQ